MKKRIVLNVFVFLCCFLVLSGCKTVPNDTTQLTQSVTDSSKDVILQPEVKDVFCIESYTREDELLKLKIRNLANKTMISFSILIRYFDAENKVMDEVLTSDDYPFMAEQGELSSGVGYVLTPFSEKIEVYITSIYYRDGSSWLNEELVLSEQNQVALTVPQEVEGIYEIKQATMDKLKLGLQIKNLSSTKTIQSYSLIVRYIDTSGKIWPLGQPCIYKGAAISPGGESEHMYWNSYAEDKKAEVYIEKIIYTNGTQWVNPDIPPEN